MNYRQKRKGDAVEAPPFWSGKRDSNSLRGHSRDINVTPSPLCGGPLGGPGSLIESLPQNKKANHKGWLFVLERKTRLELATPTLARSCSTN